MKLNTSTVATLATLATHTLIGTLVIAATGCKPARLNSNLIPRNDKSRSPLSPAGAPNPQSAPVAPLELSLIGTSLTQSAFLFSIANPKKQTERCWYFAEDWGLKQGPDQKQLAGVGLTPLTKLSVTAEYFKTASVDTKTQETSFRDGTRLGIAACGVAGPIAGKTAVGAVVLAVCGVAGGFLERGSSEKLDSTKTAEDLAAGSVPPGPVNQVPKANKAVVDMFKNTLNGKPGDGSLDCVKALGDFQTSKSPLSH